MLYKSDDLPGKESVEEIAEDIPLYGAGFFHGEQKNKIACMKETVVKHEKKRGGYPTGK